MASANPLIIRPARTEDLANLNAMHAASGRAPWSESVLEPSADRLVVVALFDEAIVGAGKTHFHAEPDRSAPAGHYLGGVTVHPGFRRRGVGTALTRSRLDWIWERATTAFYFANSQNSSSIRLHAQLGFTELARQRQIHGTAAEDPRTSLVLFGASR